MKGKPKKIYANKDFDLKINPKYENIKIVR